jgi:hypothetical protein
MINLKGILAAALVALLIGGVAGWKSRGWQAEAKLFAMRDAHQNAMLLAQQEQAEMIEAAQRKSDEVIGEFYERSLAAERTATDLAGRLRIAYARSCPGTVRLPEAAPAADVASGEPAADRGLDEAVAGVVAACQRDAAKLTALQEWLRGTR